VFDWTLITQRGIEILSQCPVVIDPEHTKPEDIARRALVRRIMREFYKLGGVSLEWRQRMERQIFVNFPGELKAFQQERKAAYSQGGFDPAAKAAYKAAVTAEYWAFYDSMWAKYVLLNAQDVGSAAGGTSE
jgi:hypothetical protein